MFLNALMLLGIGAAAVPWMLHLLSRSRYKNVDWGAMMFLESADSDPRRSSKISQFLLLLVRTAVVALLAVALARPILPGPAPVPVKGQPVTAVILLDCSAAMNVDENGRPRMVLAKGAARQVLGRHRGDRVGLELMGLKQSRTDVQPTADLWDVARRIESAEPGPGVADVAQSLKAALEAVTGRDEAGAAPRPRPPGSTGSKPFVDFYVVASRQANAWHNVDAAFRDEFRQQLRLANVTCRLFYVPVGGPEADEVAVESIKLLNPPAVVNQPAEFDVTVRNYTKVRWAGLTLAVTTAAPDRLAQAGDRAHTRVSEQPVNLAPEASATFHVTTAFRGPGTHLLSAAIKTSGGAGGGATGSTNAPAGPAGGAAGEGRFDLAVEVRDPTRALVLTGESAEPDSTAGSTSSNSTNSSKEPNPGGATAGGANAAQCLQLALAPFKAAGLPSGDSCIVDVAPADTWAGTTLRLPAGTTKSPAQSGQSSAPSAEPGGRQAMLSDYQVVILADVERLSPSQAVALKQFVYDGGGLLVAPGPLTHRDDYNTSLYRDGEGILPAALGEPTAADGSEQTALSGSDLTHPVFRFLASRPDLALSASVARYFPVTARGPGAQPLAYYVSGDPLLLESTAGKGHVLLMTTSLGTDWTSLPLSSFYLPFVQSAVRYLANTSSLTLNLHPGDAIEVPLDDVAAATDGTPPSGSAASTAGSTAGAAVVNVIAPDGQPHRADVFQAGEQAIARFADTETPGVYLLKVTGTGKPVTLTFVVHPTPEAANPSPLPPERSAWLTKDMGFEILDPAQHPLDASPADAAGRQELWRWALAGVLLLAVTEVAVARVASRAGEG